MIDSGGAVVHEVKVALPPEGWPRCLARLIAAGAGRQAAAYPPPGTP
ncbi:MAG TPA: hypothetical protein VGF91_03350 [Solirubrobacteraceae bacterium]